MRPTARYLLQVEAHVYAFSMAANILLSFFPFLIVMVSFCRHVLGWAAAEEAIYLALGDYFPGPLGDFIKRNLKATVDSRGPLQFISLFLLLFTANGIFEPLEVALNRAWGVATNRSYFRNQLVSLCLILACGGLALISTILTAFNQELWTRTGLAGVASWMNLVIYKTAAVPISILMLFLIFWLLPNAKIPAGRLLPVSILVGVVLEILKYVNLLTWPYLRAKLQNEYGPFLYSATIVIWGFIASMAVLAGAELAARHSREQEQAEARP
jgi:membrane protein